RLLRLEVVVDVADRDPGALADVAEADAVEPAGAEERERGVLYVAAAGGQGGGRELGHRGSKKSERSLFIRGVVGRVKDRRRSSCGGPLSVALHGPMARSARATPSTNPTSRPVSRTLVRCPSSTFASTARSPPA